MFDREKLRLWLSTYGVKKGYMARLLGVHPGTITTWLSGEFQPTPEHAEHLRIVMQRYEAMTRQQMRTDIKRKRGLK